MNDLISRRAAIDAICNACGKIDCDKMDKCEKLQLPPANNSETPNSSDCISRQAAMDAMETWDKFGCDPDGKLVRYDDDKHYIPYVHYEDMVHAIKHLPSAQPEIIRCKDCKHWDGVDTCDVIDASVWDNDFCSMAERREDG